MEHIAGQAFGVYAHQDVLFPFDVAHFQGYVLVLIHITLVKMEFEFSVSRREFGGDHPLDEFFIFPGIPISAQTRMRLE